MMPPRCSILENISNCIEDEDVPVVVFSSSSLALIPLHKQQQEQQDESPSIPTRKRSLYLSRVRSTKNVTFGSDHSFEIPGKADMTPDEIQSTWWSRRELKSIKHECFGTVDIFLYYDSIDLALGNHPDEEYYCLRGLEGHAPKRRSKKTGNRYQLYQTILEEQWYQYEQVGFICDPDEIANKYAPFSYKSARHAHRLGLEDQLEVSKLKVLENRLQ
jgi:hypothetical protein